MNIKNLLKNPFINNSAALLLAMAMCYAAIKIYATMTQHHLDDENVVRESTLSGTSVFKNVEIHYDEKKDKS